MRHMLKWMFIFTLVFSLNLFPIEKKPFSIDDIYRLKNISGLKISPDGKKLLFSVTESNLKEGKTNSDIFLLNVKNNEILQLTFDKSAESDPFWSPDGKKIYFISDRQDGNQLWEMDVNGGEARKISDFYTGISTPFPVKGPNGINKIFFTSTVFPECLEKEENQWNDCNKEKADKLENGPVQAHIADSLLFRHWTSYRDWQYSHLFCLDPAAKKVTAITKGEIDYPAFSVGGGEYVLSPDGKTVCIVSNHDKDAAHSTNNDLFLIDLNTPGQEPVNITVENKASDSSPAFSPDGQWIGFITQR
ncbi:MAG: DPP IV N-terminal domain-containing protein, partial [Acidobacteria bacterium]|nr:DPP IV N-terminal domain-containing protein [Acidobacteriota bacterium]